MNVLSELLAKDGVLAAGEFSYHGDRYSAEGQLSEEQSRWASIMSRAHNMGVHMQAAMLELAGGRLDGGAFVPLKGWIVRGPAWSVCGMANVFCFVDNRRAGVNEVMALLRERLWNEPDEMVY